MSRVYQAFEKHLKGPQFEGGNYLTLGDVMGTNVPRRYTEDVSDLTNLIDDTIFSKGRKDKLDPLSGDVLYEYCAFIPYTILQRKIPNFRMYRPGDWDEAMIRMFKKHKARHNYGDDYRVIFDHRFRGEDGVSIWVNIRSATAQIHKSTTRYPYMSHG
ncbi:MAG: hypothetical protein PHW76_09115 [Alphaproteobacteria bacterium]|nr:hypothetical protein [Alphaproteobacteria bacterium]